MGVDNNWKNMIEESILEYIEQIDFNSPDFNINEFKRNIAKITNVKPAVDIKWKTYEKINELKKDAGAKDFKESIDEAQSVAIYFIDADDNPIQLKYIL